MGKENERDWALGKNMLTGLLKLEGIFGVLTYFIILRRWVWRGSSSFGSFTVVSCSFE